MKLTKVVVILARISDAVHCLGRGEFGQSTLLEWFFHFTVRIHYLQGAIQHSYQSEALAAELKRWGKQAVVVVMMALVGLSSLLQAQLSPAAVLLVVCLLAAIFAGVGAVLLLKSPDTDLPRRPMQPVRGLGLALLLACGSVSAVAQTNVNEEQGMKPYDSWHGGDLDSISMTNGSALLHVPLVCFPQRGGLELCFAVHSNTKQWQLATACHAAPLPGNPNRTVCTQEWEPLPRGGLLPPFLGRTHNLPNLAVDGAYVASNQDIWLQRVCSTEPTDPNSPGQLLYDWTQNIVAPDGSVHQLANVTGALSGPTLPLRSLDATGFLQPDANTIIAANGTHYTYPSPDTCGNFAHPMSAEPTSVTDANGNQITIDGSTGAFTDTMGRVIPAAPGTATSDLSACPSGTASAKLWTVPGIANGTRNFTFCYSSVSIFTSFGDGFDYPATNSSLLTAIVLPDSTLWTLSYDHWGNVSRLGFPTGGSISYTYAIGPQTCATSDTQTSLFATSRTVDANDGSGGHQWSYNYSGSFGSNGAYSGTAVVTSPAPDSNDTVHTITSPVTGAACSIYDTQVQHYQGAHNGGTILKTAATQYSGIANPLTTEGTAINVVATQATSTSSDGHTSKKVSTYDSGNTVTVAGTTVPVVLGSVLESDLYDFSNTLVRTTLNHYLWQDNATYKSNNFLSLPVSSTTCTQPTNCADGTQANRMAQVTYGYDQTAVTPANITTGFVAPPASGNIRGNQTTVSHWLNTANSFISSTATYLDTGMTASSADPQGNTTTYTYSSAFDGAYMTQTKMPDTLMPDSGASVVHHVISGDFDFYTGLLKTFTDENGQTYSYQYDPLMLRLTQGIHPDGGKTLFSYPSPTQVERQRLITGTSYDDYRVNFDGLGRPIQTQQAVPGNTVLADTTYDVVGRVATVSNPYYQGSTHTSDPTWGVTTTQYDALSRAIKTIKQDNSFSTVQYNAPAADGAGTSVICTTAADEAGKQRQVCADALGRMVKVIEPNAVSGGANATAAVSVSGTLNSATTSGSGSAPPAASGSALTSFVASDGSSHTFYLGTNQHVYHLSWNSANSWQDQDLTAATSGVLAATGSALTSFGKADGSLHVAYRDTSNHVNYLVSSSGSWSNQDLTALSGSSVTAASNSGLTSFSDTAGDHVYYLAANQHEYHLLWNGTTWTNQDLTSLSGTTLLAASGSALTGYSLSDGTEHTAYRGANQHIYHMVWIPGTGYQNQDLTLTAALDLSDGPCADEGGTCYGVSAAHTIAFGADGAYNFLSVHGNVACNVATFGDPIPGTAKACYDLFSFPLAASTSPLTSLVDGLGESVYYLASNQHEYELWFDGEEWHNWDLTNYSGASGVAASGSALTSFPMNDGSEHSMYLGSNHHVYQMMYDLNLAEYINEDLTTASGTSTLAATGSALTSFGLSAGNPGHIQYLDANGHINHLYWNGTSWQNQDLTAVANSSSTVFDSGVVTLSVGGFTATACFGNSTNSVCNGQPVNTTVAQVATALAGAINVSASPATAVVSGSSLSLVWKIPGAVTPDVTALSSTHDNPSTFPNPSFTSPLTSFGGGSEPAPSVSNSPYITLYQYDTLGNMLRVDQKGSAPTDSTQWRTRTFAYDSLSRLLTAVNPESGTISFAYDADGNLVQKIAPKPNQTGTATVTTTYTYDALNRPLDRTYSDTTPTASFRYDYSSFLGHSFTSPVGRGVAAVTANGTISSFVSYDPMGRVASAVQCNPGVTGCETFSAGYNNLGNVTSVTYPANGFSVTYGYDNIAARLISASDSNGVTYAQSPTYLASGAMQEFVSPNFNNFKYHVDYNSRLQPTEIWAGSAQGANALFDKQYSYDAPNTSHMNNGNIYTVTNVKDDHRTQSFTYDPLNRLLTAGDKTHWSNSYAYDAWGNLYQKNPGAPAGENMLKTADTNNRLSGLTYDSAGNVIVDDQGNTLVYDAENRIISTTNNTSGTTTYTYGAGGQRITKSNGATVANYWFGPSGDTLAETDSSGNFTNYVFFGGQRLARNLSGDIKYYITDHLHSTAIFADKSGTVLDDNDFYPWGGVVPGVGSTTSNNHYKFTGKERDTESGLDYFGARYYTNATGRFMSPDWAVGPIQIPYAEFGDPQSLNLYSYVRNSPVVRVDPDGHDFENPGFQKFNDDDGGSNIESTHDHITNTTTIFNLAQITVTVTQVGVPGVVFYSDSLSPAPAVSGGQCSCQAMSKPIEDVQKIPILGKILGVFWRHLFFDVTLEDGTEHDVSGQWVKKDHILHTQDLSSDKVNLKETNDFKTGRKVGAPVHDCAMARAIVDGAGRFKDIRYVLFPGPNSNTFYHWLANLVGFPDVHPFGTPGYNHAMKGQ
jgi:RHS repeat-associated protein